MQTALHSSAAWLARPLLVSSLLLAGIGQAQTQEQLGAPIQGPLTKQETQGPLTKPRGNPVTNPALISLIDEIVAVAAGEVITLHDLLREIQSPDYQQSRTQLEKLPPAERERAFEKLQTDAIAHLVERLIRTRAGQDRGFDQAIVESLVDNQVSLFREQQGGPTGFQEALRRSGFTPESFRDWRRRALYLGAWEQSITGAQAGPVGRIDRDTFVRPGQLYATYKRLVASPSQVDRSLVGAAPAVVELSEIILSFDANGGEKNTLDLADKIRRSVLDGREEFDTLALEHSERRRPEHITSDMEGVSRTAKGIFGNDHLLVFSENAAPGEISRPLRSSKGGIYLYQLVKRQPAKQAEPFDSLELQKRLRSHIGQQRDRIRLGQGTEHLLRTIRIQPSELAQFMIQPEWLYRPNNSHTR